MDSGAKSGAPCDAIPGDLPAEDRAFLAEWFAQAGDGASAAAVRGRVRVLLALQAEHPHHLPLAALVQDPRVQAVLFAKPAARSGARKRLRRQHGRGDQ